MLHLLMVALLSAPPGGALSDADLAKLAAETAPAARASLANARLASVRVRAADQKFWPRVGLSARYTRLSETDPTVLSIPGVPIPVTIPAPEENQLAVGLQVALPLSDWLTRWDAAKVATRHGVEVERALSDVARRRAAAEARVLAWSVRRARLGIRVAEAALGDAQVHLTAAEVLLKADAGSLADVRLAEAGVAAARLEVARAKNAEAMALAALRVAVHADVEVGEGEGAGEGARVSAEDAVRARPELRAIEAGEAALRAEGDVVDAGRWPRLDLVANAQVASPSSRGLGYDDEAVALWDASLVASWSVNGLWESNTADDERAAKREKLSSDRQALEDGVRLELAQAQQMLADADAAGAASAAMLTAAEEGQRVRLAAYRAGKATSVELSEAEAQLTRARLGVVDALIARRVAEVRLAYASGAPLY